MVNYLLSATLLPLLSNSIDIYSNFNATNVTLPALFKS